MSSPSRPSKRRRKVDDFPSAREVAAQTSSRLRDEIRTLISSAAEAGLVAATYPTEMPEHFIEYLESRGFTVKPCLSSETGQYVTEIWWDKPTEDEASEEEEEQEDGEATLNNQELLAVCERIMRLTPEQLAQFGKDSRQKIEAVRAKLMK